MDWISPKNYFLTRPLSKPEKKLTLGFSPCPNDTFIFEALANGRIETGELRFEPVLEDVETLNQWALEGKLDISKISFATLLQLKDRYALLPSGSALGRGCGPLLVSRTPISPDQVSSRSIAIPGIHTTANLLLDFSFPSASRRIPMRFSAIEDAVLEGTADLGVLIHENRFTYEARGLFRVLDLGEFWEAKTGAPIPLAGIAAKKSLPPTVRKRIGELIRESLVHAYSQGPELSAYVTSHAQAMDPEVMRRHISLYVNAYTMDLGPEGRKAVRILSRQAFRAAGEPVRKGARNS